MDIRPWYKERSGSKIPLLIAGPCSAESPEQLLQIVNDIKELGVNYIRAGVWKPRTRPHSFQGHGKSALAWITEIQKTSGVNFAIEVATPEHVEQALQADISFFWIGARTTVNPFAVQEIADSLKGVKKTVFIKNPINPELALWIGAIERIHNAGVEHIGAIHRGFSSFQKGRYRNQPFWQIPLMLKSEFPNLPLIADPSHIAGERELIQEVSQKAMDLGYDGLMIETHPRPEKALSDPDQQITPIALAKLLADLIVSSRHSSNATFSNRLVHLREKIDTLDQELVDTLATRMKLAEQLGEYKKEHGVTVFQLERWQEIIRTRPEWASLQGLSPEFIKAIFTSIHDESIRLQTEIVHKNHLPNH